MTRGRRSAVRTVALAAGLVMSLGACGLRVGARAADGPTPRMPRDAARFEIARTDDSTVTFRREEAAWVAAGQVGIAVDPLRRDALVARLRVLDVDGNGVARALVTGQTTRVEATHVVLLTAPRAAPWRQRTFWVGSFAGAVTGVLLASLLL